MLVTEVYNKAEWEITGRDDDTEGRARKSKFSVDALDSFLLTIF